MSDNLIIWKISPGGELGDKLRARPAKDADVTALAAVERSFRAAERHSH